MIKIKTKNPMSMIELLEFTGRDAFCMIDGNRCRILFASGGQEKEVDKVAYERGRKFALKKVSISKGKKYDYLAFECE